MALHWVNDLPQALKQMSKMLKPDGMFIAAMLGGDTLHELRASLAIAEQEREGGVSAHVSPMLPVADACGIMTGAGLQMVTVDTERVIIDYDNAFACMRHLWWMGESNACTNRRPTVSRHTMLSAAAIYRQLYGNKIDETVPATFDFVYMIGWAPHESQKKPLLPGQGKISLTKLGKGFKA